MSRTFSVPNDAPDMKMADRLLGLKMTGLRYNERR